MTLAPTTPALMQDRLRDTLGAIAGGIDRLPLVAALALVDEWEATLKCDATTEVRTVADKLARLRTVLIEGDARPATLGTAVADLGTVVRQGPCPTNSRDLVILFERIGNLLHHAGYALRGVHPS